MDNLLQAVKSCGVSLSIWKNKGGEYDRTSIMGVDKKKLLHELPTKFELFLSPRNKAHLAGNYYIREVKLLIILVFL